MAPPLAQLTFAPCDGSEESSSVEAGGASPLRAVGELLGVEPTELSNALCTRQLVTRDDVVTVPLTSEQARDLPSFPTSFHELRCRPLSSPKLP